MTDPDGRIDPRLRHALAHAPDADAVPPASLDAAVRAAAWAHVGAGARGGPAGVPPATPAEPTRAPAPSGLRAWWRRPAAAPALATVLLGTLVLGEHLAWTAVAGFGVVLAAALTINSPDRRVRESGSAT